MTDWLTEDQMVEQAIAVEAATMKKLQPIILEHMQSIEGSKDADGPTHCLGQMQALIKLAIVFQRFAEYMDEQAGHGTSEDGGRERFFHVVDILWNNTK